MMPHVERATAGSAIAIARTIASGSRGSSCSAGSGVVWRPIGDGRAECLLTLGSAVPLAVKRPCARCDLRPSIRIERRDVLSSLSLGGGWATMVVRPQGRPPESDGDGMAKLRTIDLIEVDDLFRMGGGFVLDFSDRTFAAFFAHDLNIDIDADVYRVDGHSKAKRLRQLLRQCSDADAVRVLKALWMYREALDRRQPPIDATPNAEARFGALIASLTGQGAASPQAGPAPSVVPAFDRTRETQLRAEMLGLQAMAPHPRGFAFEKFLVRMFDFYQLEPRGSFRLVGEQIDGSFVLSGETYLLEAKWHDEPTQNQSLHAFHGKLDQKAAWTRGLFVSYAGFTEGALASFGVGKRVVCMDGLDLFDALDRHIPLDMVLQKKVRRMAEEGRTHIPVRELFP
jgi:hypothetical protein